MRRALRFPSLHLNVTQPFFAFSRMAERLGSRHNLSHTASSNSPLWRNGARE